MKRYLARVIEQVDRRAHCAATSLRDACPSLPADAVASADSAPVSMEESRSPSMAIATNSAAPALRRGQRPRRVVHRGANPLRLRRERGEDPRGDVRVPFTSAGCLAASCPSA